MNRSPLRRTGAIIRRSSLRRVGRRKEAEIARHGEFRREYLQKSPFCEAGMLLLPVDKAPQCGHRATEIHERLARSHGGDKHLSCPGNLVRVCRPCHRFITDNPTFASVVGLYLRREHELQGPHATDCPAAPD